MLSAICFVLSGLGRKGLPQFSLCRLIRCCNRDLVSCHARNLIELRIFGRGALPRKVPGHTVQLDALPDALVSVEVQSLADGFEERRAGVLDELEAGASALLDVERFDGVVETAGGANNRDGAIFQAVNLIQT